MAFVHTTDKWEAAHAFINTWLKDPAYYCNNCGDTYVACCNNPRPALLYRELYTGADKQDATVLHCKSCGSEIWQCCENPQIGTNKDHTYALIKQNREMRKTLSNEFASNKTNTMRWGVSLPPRLYSDLNAYFVQNLQEPLFKDKPQMREFMKRFKQFTICERI